ncbi:MAG: prolyl-tRNA synthetase [Candidatus Terrybacteria bacterium CG10_big_fil_rev_8_21_14_0_10_41_10]|uniref:Proline--tRNA ligase n=1 Tax=Candidatus Terrybacteria bacterium CG10_big_fil_rev_8_21_14_0_10_41_10 TaxID=1975026 RepID=A0A2M8LAA7_9BACT|nr:MAG: prolyl-tRNA synthetase [Candidatus Terrybacteria bacterium CG10_big_fil_rev_8_21_14_0_10_41_10]
MKQSKLFPRARKEAPKDEVSKNAQLLIRAGFIDKLMAGVYTYLPLGLRTLKKIENVIRDEMTKAGGQELLMPSLHPKENWQITGRWDSLDDLFKFTSFYSETELALGPTHEEVISPLVKKFNLSYKDLPLGLFQFQNKFRDEKRAKSGILRGREFLMKDYYSFHASEEDLDKYYENMKTHYENIFARCGIGNVTHLTFASGGSFSKYSHEYQAITEAGEDIIYVCLKCSVALNREIVDNSDKACPECGNKNLEEKKSVEVGNIFKLKDKYSSPFNLKFTNDKGEDKPMIMGCYGIGLGRLMGTITEILSDENGMRWPTEVAPFKAHVLEIGKTNDDVKKAAEELSAKLETGGIDTLHDDRDDVRAGEKFAEADLIGLPYRIVVSDKTLSSGGVELKLRKETTGKIIKTNEILNEIQKL